MNSLTLMGLTRLARSVPERLATGCVIVSGDIAAPTLALTECTGIEQLSAELRQTRGVRAIVLSTRWGGAASLDRAILAIGQRTSPIVVVVCRSPREASRVITATGRSPALRIVLEGSEPLGALVGAFICEGADGSHLSLVLRLIRTRWGEAASSILELVLGSGFRTTAVHVLANRVGVSRSTLGRKLLANGARSPEAVVQGAMVAAACALGRLDHLTLGAAARQLRVADPRALAALLRTVTGEEYSAICARYSANSTMGVLDDLIPRIDRFVRCT